MKTLLIFLLIPVAVFGQLELPFPVKMVNPNPVDYFYYEADGTPWDNTAEVLAGIPVGLRYNGMTVNVAGSEYWFSGGTGDGFLIVKLLMGTPVVDAGGLTVFNIPSDRFGVQFVHTDLDSKWANTTLSSAGLQTQSYDPLDDVSSIFYSGAGYFSAIMTEQSGGVGFPVHEFEMSNDLEGDDTFLNGIRISSQSSVGVGSYFNIGPASASVIVPSSASFGIYEGNPTTPSAIGQFTINNISLRSALIAFNNPSTSAYNLSYNTSTRHLSMVTVSGTPQDFTIAASTGLSSSTTGGAVTIRGGNAFGSSGNGVGGQTNIQSGTGRGTGRGGNIVLTPGNNFTTPGTLYGYVVIQIAAVPTSSAGLPSGAIWRDAADGNTLKIVP